MAAKPLFRHPQWNACYRAFIARQPTVGTRVAYGEVLKRFFTFIRAKYGKERTPDKVTRADIEEFLQRPVQAGKRVGSALSPWTYNHYQTVLCSFYTFASEYEIEWRGHMRPILRGRPPTLHLRRAQTGEVDRDMTEEEVHAFFAAIEQAASETLIGKRDYALFWTLFVTGRRRREICQLTRGDLEQVKLFRGGQLVPGWIFHFKAKWRPSRESAEMPEECLAAIREFHTAAGRDLENMAAVEPLFPGVATKAKRDLPLSLHNVDARFRHYARIAGLGENVCVHSLRWENAYQRYLATGKDLMKVRDQMGWRTIEQCAHYVAKRERKLAGDPIAGRVAAKFARE